MEDTDLQITRPTDEIDAVSKSYHESSGSGKRQLQCPSSRPVCNCADPYRSYSLHPNGFSHLADPSYAAVIGVQKL